jgi:hypothetical protein
VARKSRLSAKTNKRRNTKSGRARMKSSSFADPTAKKFRIDDKAHAAVAKGRITQAKKAGRISAAKAARMTARANKVLKSKGTRKRG